MNKPSGRLTAIFLVLGGMFLSVSAMASAGRHHSCGIWTTIPTQKAQEVDSERI
ncbi:MAG: hypothetical protein V3S51_02450 [Dehalococcoidia bacterium]